MNNLFEKGEIVLHYASFKYINNVCLFHYYFSMKPYISYFGGKIAGGFISGIVFVTTVISVTYAISGYPDTPAGEDTGGKFTTKFAQIFSQLAFAPAKVTVTPDICTSGGACLSTAAQKISVSGAPVLYNLYNGSAWSNMNTQTIRDQWRWYQSAGCDKE